MSSLRVTTSFTVELTLDELRTVHRALHLLSAEAEDKGAPEARALALKLALDRKREFEARSQEMTKLLANIESGTAPRPRTRNPSDDPEPTTDEKARR